MSSKTRKETIKAADEELLATLGYKQEFMREFTPFELFGIFFSIIGVLPSIASVLLFAIPNGGPVAMVWGWAVASIFILIVGMAMAELGSAAPTSGGLYFWTYSFSSPRWKTLLCWIVGYANTVGSIAGVASIDWGCAVQVMAAVSIGSNQTFTPTNAQIFGVYVSIVLCHAVICSSATKFLARLQTAFVVINVSLVLAVIVALPAATPREFKNSASFALGNFSNANGWPNGFAFILSFLAPSWTIDGFDTTVHISEEASNAATAVPWAIVCAIGITGVLGWAVNVSFAFCMGTDMDAILQSPIGQPMATIFFNSFGQKGTLVFWSFIVVVQFMMGSNFLLAASRQSFAFARDGALPFSGWLYRMNKRTKTPVNTVWFVAACTIALGLLAFAGPAAINAVFALCVVALYTSYTIPIAARFLGKNDFKPGPFSLGIFSLPVAITAVVYMVFMCTVFLFPTTPITSVPDMNYTVVVLGGTLILSLMWYYFPVYGGVHWFTGPVSNVDSRSLARDGDSEISDEKKQSPDGTMPTARTIEILNR